jgi:hypothetical protein
MDLIVDLSRLSTLVDRLIAHQARPVAARGLSWHEEERCIVQALAVVTGVSTVKVRELHKALYFPRTAAQAS